MKKDWLLFVDTILIIAIGLTTLYSTVVGEENILGGGGILNKQLIFVLVGLILYFAVTYFNYRYTGHPQILIPLYVILVLALVYLLIFGIEINYSKRWIKIGGVQLQVSEFAKLGMIMITAWLMSMHKKYSMWKLAAISFASSVVLGGLIFVEPDASTAILLIVINMLMLFTVLPNQVRNAILVFIVLISAAVLNLIIGLNFNLLTFISIGFLILAIILGLVVTKKGKMLLVIALIVGVVLGGSGRLAWNHVLADYQKDRIESFINPEADTQGSGFQVNQAKVAIGSGTLIGKGFGHGTQSKLNFLPEHQTDFVFAAFAEEFGLIGASFVLLLYAFAVFRIFHNATLTDDLYGSLICIGFGIKFLLETLVNIGMNLGLTPATGVALPLMSAGGSILMSTMIGLGLVQSVVVHRNVIDTN
jgi:rod shape determining protein RodA